ncbi:MAG: PCP reductase family protein [Candidatus Aceula meridiana]|nr:PCP reductase family protein [Candidatus Aceula meridiana]
MSKAWNKDAQEKFDQIIKKTPVFLRSIAQDKVSKRAEKLALGGGRQEITEKDMVDAFFAETPFGFHGPMKCDMEEIGINYEKYGHAK